MTKDFDYEKEKQRIDRRLYVSVFFILAVFMIFSMAIVLIFAAA